MGKRKPKNQAPPRDKWEKSADRENARRFQKAPLFVHAGIVPKATPGERRARFEGQRERSEQAHEERIRLDAERAAELREQVCTMVTPEQFEALLLRRASWPSDLAFFKHVLDDLAPKAATPPAAPIVPSRRGPTQTPLFVEVRAKGKVLEVPTVAEGKAIPIADLAAAHGIDVDAPTLPPAAPCPDCGWLPRAERGIDLDIHPTTCPSMRAVLLGLAENCADCRARGKMFAGPPYGACAAHRERALACAREGCIPGPPRWSYMTGEMCQRCLISMDAAPYLEIHRAA